MTDEEIKQNALKAEKEHGKFNYQYQGEAFNKGYITGAHSRDEEMKKLEESKRKLRLRLMQQIHELRNPWISVDERLPEKTKGIFSCQVRELEEDKIVYYKDTRGYIHTGYLNARNNWRDLDRDNAAFYPVTHWMPIPVIQTQNKEE